VQQLLLQFVLTYAMLNFQCKWRDFGTFTATLHVVAGCWCQYAHAIVEDEASQASMAAVTTSASEV